MVNDPDTVRTLDATEVPEKAIQGTPWYTVLSNQAYTEAFGYIGAYVEEREKLIEDGFADVTGPNGEMDEKHKEQRCEQSDMVFLLMNLAVVPDEVIKKTNFHIHGWAEIFKHNMDEYKRNWQGEGRWKYQDAELEERYTNFVKQRQAEDSEYKESEAEYQRAKAEFDANKKEEEVEMQAIN